MELQQRLDRAYQGWGLETVEYDQGATLSPTGHRDDCSGYASMVLGLPAPGLDTVSLVSSGAIVAITTPTVGDFLGLCGPGTLGNAGHIALITGISGNRYEVLEQRGGTVGPTVGVYQPLPAGWGFYRDGNKGVDDVSVKMFRVTNGALAGLIGVSNGPSWYHLPAGPEWDPGLYVRACTGLWNITAEQIIDVNEEWLPGFGTQIPGPTGAVTLNVSKVDLVQAAFEGAQRAEKE